MMYLRPALAGLFLAVHVAVGSALAAPSDNLGSFSRDAALAFSQSAIGNTLDDVTLSKPDGQPTSLAAYRGKPLVVSLIFTSCHHVCPTTTQYLQEVVRKARAVLGADSFQVITVGFDTPNDGPERMAQFRKTNGISANNWDFLAADAAAIDQLTRQLGFIYTPSPRGFDHLIQASVIDAQGKVYRQVYGIRFPTPQLIEPLKDQVFGTPAEQSALDYLENRVRLFCTVYDPATDSYYIDISVFIGTFVGLMVSIVFGSVLVREWRRSIGTNT